MPNEALARKIYSLQNKIVRELNNAHIFLEQAQPLLIETKVQYEGSKSKEDRRYYVPSIDKKRKIAKRTDAELKEGKLGTLSIFPQKLRSILIFS